MRKKLIVLIAAIAVFASVFTFTAMPVAYADNEEESVTAKYDYAVAFEKTEDRAAYANPFDYIKATDKESGDKISLGNTAKEVEKIEVYSLESEDAAKGGVVDENDYKFDATNATITYYVTDAIHEGAVWYFVEVKMTGDDTVYEFRVKVSLDAGKELKYIDFSTEDGADALQSVKDKITDTEDDTFTVPEDDIWELVENPVFSRADVKTSVYVSKPGSNWSSNSSSSSITLSKAGTYRFYVLYQAIGGAELSVDELTYKEGGYYDGDKLVVPVFTFNYGGDDALSINATGGNEEGIIDYAYTGIKFEISNGSMESLELQYCEEDAADDSDKWKKATEEEAEYEEFTSVENITFTPLKKGYYRVVCVATGATVDEEKTGYSKHVSVQRRYEVVKYEDTRLRDFFAQNWASLIFLGIAVLCLVGIFIIAFYKPKTPDGGSDNGVEEDAAEAEDAEEEEKLVDETEEEGISEATEEVTDETEEATETAETTETTEETAETTETTETAEEVVESAETDATENKENE